MGLLLFGLLIFRVFVIVFAIVLAFYSLVLGFINIRMNKKNDLSFIRKMSKIEIYVAFFFGIILFLPNMIISIIRLITLSKIQSNR